MDELDKRIDKIREMIKTEKAKEYAVTNETLSGLDEYIKKLYLKLLGTVIQYKNDPSDMQIIYLNRIACGMGAEEPAEELMRMALEISETDVQEFFSVMKEKNIKFYFAIDGLILLKIGNAAQENYEYFAELLELSGVAKRDIEAVSQIAKSVLTQESAYYDEVKNWIAESAKTYDFLNYIKSYYAGAIIDLQDETRYCSPDVNQVYDISFPMRYDAKKVVFENLNIHLKEDWFFEGCDEVVFRNCKMYGDKEHFIMNNVGSVTFDNCVCEDFGNRVAIADHVSHFVVTACEFRNCGYVYNDDQRFENESEDGGVFLLLGVNDSVVEFKANSIEQCYIESVSDTDVRKNGAFLGMMGEYLGFGGRWIGGLDRFILKNNMFRNCNCIHGGKRKNAMIAGSFFAKVMEEENNQCIGGITSIFEGDKERYIKDHI